jgi:hypothetical protein
MNPTEKRRVNQRPVCVSVSDREGGAATSPSVPSQSPRSDAPARSSWTRRSLLLVPIAAAVVPVSLFVRSRFAHTSTPPDSIRATRQYQDPALLARAWALPAAQRMRPAFRSQQNRSSCGPASVANVFRSLGHDVDEGQVMEDTGMCWTGVCFGGLTLDELATVAATNQAQRATLLRDLSYPQFTEHLRRSNHPDRRYIVNFHREPLFRQGAGHHSPIGGYLEAENLVFVLDTNDSYRPFLVDARRLFEAVNTVDSSSGKTRGLLALQ